METGRQKAGACPLCGTMRPAAASVCPGCGYVTRTPSRRALPVVKAVRTAAVAGGGAAAAQEALAIESADGLLAVVQNTLQTVLIAGAVAVVAAMLVLGVGFGKFAFARGERVAAGPDYLARASSILRREIDGSINELDTEIVSSSPTLDCGLSFESIVGAAFGRELRVELLQTVRNRYELLSAELTTIENDRIAGKPPSALVSRIVSVRASLDRLRSSAGRFT